MLSLPRLAVASIAALALPISAQAQAACEHGTAEHTLDIGDVRAALYNTGNLFYKSSLFEYQVPYTPGEESPNAVFTLAMWVSGEREGQVKFAGSTYYNWEFWPGPLDADGQTTPERCAAFDTIWRVSIDDLRGVTADGVGPITNPDLIDWPIAHGAPYFVDLDGDDRRGADEPRRTLAPGDPGYSLERGEGAQINLEAGERPDLVGDQAAWWILNDNAGPHGSSRGEPLQIEMQVLAVAFRTPAPALAQSTVYEITLVNRGSTPLDDTRFSAFTVYQIGGYGDDAIGSDERRGMAIMFNRDEEDRFYGTSPPALGMDLLSGAEGVMWIDDENIVPGGVDRPTALQRYQQSLWADGTPLTRGGFGYNPGSTEVTRWRFDGDVVRSGYWSEEYATADGLPYVFYDGETLLNAPAQTLAPGESRQIDLALLFSEGGDGRTRFHNVSRLLDISDGVQTAYDQGGTRTLRSASVAYTPAPPRPPPPTLLAPEAGADFDEAQPDSVTFSWSPVPGTDRYLLRLGDTPSLDARPKTVFGTTVTLSRQDVPFNTQTSYWSVEAANWGGSSPLPTARSFSYYRYIYIPDVLRIEGVGVAFIEMEGPGGADPCGPDAVSTRGCDLIGNAIVASFNGTGDYLGGSIGDGPQASLPFFAPHDYEIRFTEEGSYAYYALSSGTAIRVPFEVWDIGSTPPPMANDPRDDVRLVPILFGGGPDECTFGYAGPTQYGFGPTTQRIYAYYPVSSYTAWETAIAPLVDADPDGCPTDPATAAASAEIDFGRGRPLQRFILEQGDGGAEADGLTGTVIRFYTNAPDPAPPEEPEEPTPDPDAPLRLQVSIQPNPVVGSATVPFELASPSPIRLRVVDMLGRNVAVLAEGLLQEGRYQESLDRSRLASGVYVLVLDTIDARVTTPFTVVR